MALPPAFLDELRARTPLASLVGRRVKLTRSGRNWKGCCPFHNERSPSFQVYEDGFHCFGCGAHGDAITFVMQTEGASFPEAVERLAGEAGLEVPKPSPRAAEQEQRRLDVTAVLDLAQQSFVRRLHEAEGAAGLAYLRGRGLTDDTIQRFGLGWSGEGRGALVAELGRHGAEPARLLEAGLLRPDDDGAPGRELYWNRVTFPIRDRRGRLVSFGARALGDAKPKYINGPETEVFHKRRGLYGLDLAREGVRRGGTLLVVEGYMDVIALHQAGFAGAVAPLGTALTEEQMAELWRLGPAPVLCFDGDAAGGRAAERAVMLALPLLKPGQTLGFASLPGGEDPDSLVRAGGPARFQAVLDGKAALVDALFAALRQGAGSGPEQQAAFLTRLQGAAAQIPDRTLASEYRTALRTRFYEARRGTRRDGRGGAAPAVPRAPRGPVSADAIQDERGRCLTAILLRHPVLLRDVEEAYAGLRLPPGLSRLRDTILHVPDHAELDSATLLAHLTESGTADEAAQAVSASPVPLPSCASPDAMPAEAEAGWWHIFGLMHRGHLDEEVEAARQECGRNLTPDTQRRLIALRTAQDRLHASDADADPES